MKPSTSSDAALSRSSTAVSDVENQTVKPRSHVAVYLDSFTPYPWIQIPLCILLGIVFAIATGACSGLLTIIIGHAILRKTHHAGYDLPLLTSVHVGVLGGIPILGFAMIVLILAQAYRQALRRDGTRITRPNPVSQLIHVILAVGLSAASSATGVRLLHVIDHGFVGLDTTHAAQAGALGATIFASPAALQALFLLISDCRCHMR